MRPYAGFLLVLLLSAYSVASLLQEQKALYDREAKFRSDAIGRYQDRFQGVREKLPPQGIFGYFSDISDHTENRAAMALTQYALAPLVLREITDLPTVVGNFHRGYPSPEELDRKGLSLRFDAGSGVVLFGKATRK
jgi:hypothetical protein